MAKRASIVGQIDWSKVDFRHRDHRGLLARAVQGVGLAEKTCAVKKGCQAKAVGKCRRCKRLYCAEHGTKHLGTCIYCAGHRTSGK
jgi:hypothetical protein